MFHHILVPLDGSRLAEAALPAARSLAETLGARVSLLHVIEEDAPQTVHGDTHLGDAREARAYLETVAQKAFPRTLQVQTHVHTSPTAHVVRSLVEHINELHPDLLVMCTHGKAGVRDLFFGNIAQQVVGSGSIPVMLIRPRAEDASLQFQCRRILLPLDGKAAHELAIPSALYLASAYRAELDVLLVVPTLDTLPSAHAPSGIFMPGATDAVLDIAQEEARSYLQARLTQARERGISASAEVARGDPAAVIAERANASPPDLIALATHGKAGMEAFWASSVAPKVSSRVLAPLLLVPSPS